MCCINYIINSLFEALRFPQEKFLDGTLMCVLCVCSLVFLYDTFCVENCVTFGGGGGGGGGVKT